MSNWYGTSTGRAYGPTFPQQMLKPEREPFELPSAVYKHKDGYVPLRVYRSFEGNGHRLRVYCTVLEDQNFAGKPGTYKKAFLVREQHMPYPATKPEVADALVAIADLIAMKNGVYVKITNQKVLDRLRSKRWNKRKDWP